MARVKPLARAAVIAVGSELLTPYRTDTNSLHITAQLNLLGIDVLAKAAVGDDRRELAHVIRSLLERVDLLVVSGGLGPTDDDVTREVVSAELGRPMAEDAAIVERLRARFAARGFTMPMPENNRRQAMVPAGAVVVENAFGSAPGLWIDEPDRVVLLLPGPPRELEPMLASLVNGPLAARSPGAPLIRRVVRITGRIESQTDEALQPLYRAWEQGSPPIAATILSGLGHIELYLSTRAESRARAERMLADAVSQALQVLGADAYSTDGRPLEAVVGDLLAQRGLRIGVAESCTGGLITSRLTDVAGSSRYVVESVVTYANESKTRLLGVEPALIAAHGAVSEPVALAMAGGVRARAGVEVGIGVTGIAGPGGGTPDKPVGTVAVAAVTPSEVRSRTFRFHGERNTIKFQASQAALDMIRRMLIP
jgi:nicotinamide-nucleotide amidase